MPNWVHNTITITGSDADRGAFLAKLKEPVSTDVSVKKDFIEEFKNPTPAVLGSKTPEEFTFETFVPIPDDIFADYHTVADGKEPPNNWYNWNVNNWGTKWNASDPSVVSHSDTIEITFDTAWAAPDPIFQAMSLAFPALSLDIRWVEEQGFGAEFTLIDGEESDRNEWNIPESHAEEVAIYGQCNTCSYEDEDEEYLHEDCPRKS